MHTGPNHLEEPDFSTEKIEKDYFDTIFRIKLLCPNTKIIISSLLPRKELHFKMTIASFNDFLLAVCNSTQNVKFMRNINIKPYMLTDKKHVDDKGFKTLLGNIRYTIFGKTPRYIKYHHQYHEHEYEYHHEYYHNE